jgi:ribosomal protein S16
VAADARAPRDGKFLEIVSIMLLPISISLFLCTHH